MSIEQLWDTPHLNEMLGVPYARLKSEVVLDAALPEEPIAKKKRLDDHFQMLRVEFKGRARIEFYHAVLIVLIRRQIKLLPTLELFFDLWDKEADFLCERLSLRWIVSACDTICDFPRNPQVW